MTTELPTADDLRNHFDYDPATGIIKPKVGSRSSRNRDGDKGYAGYVMVRIGGRTILAHRVIWALVHGYWPEGSVIHVNGDKSDNRIDNLRLAAGNSASAHRSDEPSDTFNGKLRIRGIAYHGQSKVWRSYAFVGDDVRIIGEYGSAEEAEENRSMDLAIYGL